VNPLIVVIVLMVSRLLLVYIVRVTTPVLSAVSNDMDLTLRTLSKVDFITLTDMMPVLRLRVSLKHVSSPFNAEFSQFLVNPGFLGCKKRIYSLWRYIEAEGLASNLKSKLRG